MATQFEARQMQVRPLSKDILVSDMDMGEQITASGIVIKSDDGKAHGVRPRWARVYKIGDSCELDVKVGQWILIEHGRWTRKIKIDDGENIKEIQKIEISAVLAVSDSRPSDVHIGQEFSHGSSATFSPDQFL